MKKKYDYKYFKDLDENSPTEVDFEKLSVSDRARLESLQGEFRAKMSILKEIRDLNPSDLTDEKRTTRDSLLADVKRVVGEIENFPQRKRDDYDLFDDLLDGDENPRQSHGGLMQKRDFRSMFYGGDTERTLDRGDFKNGSEFIEVIGSARFDPRLKRASMVEGIPSSGGFAVPEEFSAQWLDDSLPTEIVRPLCQVWPMTTLSRKIPSWDGEDQTDGALFGGFAMEFLAEEATATKQTGKVRLIKLEAKKGAIYCDISSELEADGLGFEDQLRNALTKSIGYGIDKHCIGGSGAGQPQGIFNSACLISVAKEAGQSADSIVYENLTKMYGRQLNKSRAVWLFNDDTVPQLMELSIAVGTGGSHVKVMNEKDGKFTIFGRPVFFTPHMKTIGDKGDSGFIDFGAYALGMRKDLSIDRSIAPGWTKDLVSYRIIIRFDGMGVLSKAVTPESGATLSPFVTLDERA